MLTDLAEAELGDPRRVARAQQVVRRLAAAPGASLPDAMGTEAELEGAYRLFNNEAVSFAQLIDAHIRGASLRAQAAGTVLAIHDTTDCHFPHADPAEVGYLNTGKAGFRLHLSLLVDVVDWKRPLGLAAAETLARANPPRKRGAKHARSSYHSARDPNKEFGRWWRGIDATAQRFVGTPTQVIHVADREADAYELLAGMQQGEHRFVIRSRHNRTVEIADGETLKLDALLERAEFRLTREVPLSKRQPSAAPRGRRVHPPRETRTAHLRFTSTRATLNRPAVAMRTLPKQVALNVLHVFEVDPPAGEEPVTWTLLTSEPLDTVAQVEMVVDTYRCRWLIEELNKALKTGCVVQTRQLESYDALTTMLALSLPIAVELLALRTAARQTPALPATHVLGPDQLAALRHLSDRPLPPNPDAQDVLWCVAGLGGHIKNNGWPGWQVLQRGLEKFLAFFAGWSARSRAEM